MEAILLFRLAVIVLVVVGVGFALWHIQQKPDLAKAREQGLKQARQCLSRPVLLDDYAKDNEKLRQGILAKIEEGEIDAFIWSGYVFFDPPHESKANQN